MKRLNFIADNISPIPCSICGGEVREFSVPNKIWNAAVRKDKHETSKEYLCIWCFASFAIEYFEERDSIEKPVYTQVTLPEWDDENMRPKTKMPNCPQCGEDEFSMLRKGFAVCNNCGLEIDESL